MSTIAYKNGVMCADSQIFEGGCMLGKVLKIKKIIVGENTMLAAAAGYAPSCQKFLEWCETGQSKDIMELKLTLQSDDDFEGLIVYSNAPRRFLSYENSMEPTIITADYYAIGSGRPFALGALAAGATVTQAVHIACKFDIYSGGNLQTQRF